MIAHYFLECLLSVTYINSVTQGAFYSIDLVFFLAFTFVEGVAVNLRGTTTVKFSMH